MNPSRMLLRSLCMLVLMGCGRHVATTRPPGETLAIGNPPGALEVEPGAPVVMGVPADSALMATPGPDTRPLPGRTTVAPMPVPGDRTGEVTRRMTTMNVPRTGVTLVSPPPELVTAPQLLDHPFGFPEPSYNPPPEYPRAAREAGIQGTVLVAALVREDGSVGEARIERSVPGLDEAALVAVRHYRFKPAMGPGGPIAVWVRIPVDFRLH